MRVKEKTKQRQRRVKVRAPPFTHASIPSLLRLYACERHLDTIADIEYPDREEQDEVYGP